MDFTISKTFLSVQLLFIILGACQGLTQQECGQFNHIQRCYVSLQASLKLTQDNALSCRAIVQYITCMTTVACDCGLSNSSSVHLQLTYISGLYSFRQCEQYTGPVPLKQGLACSGNFQDKRTETELFVMTTALSKLILDLEQTCSGIQSCYSIYDDHAAIALYNHSLVSYCSILDASIVCVENAACKCGKANDPNITDDVAFNSQNYFRSCSFVKTDIVQKNKIYCHANGTARPHTVCDRDNPIYECFNTLDNELASKGNGRDVLCPAMRSYIQCTEEIACECGLIRAANVYRAITVAVASFDDSVCAELTGPLTVTPGMACPDGSGTRPDERALILALSEDVSVVNLEMSCKGVKACYKTLDINTGAALFNKDIKRLCRGQKTFIECMEETFCQCGQLDTTHAKSFLKFQRDNHKAACVNDSLLRDDFTCQQGSLNLRCSGTSDCQAVTYSECNSLNKCECKQGYVYNSTISTNECTQVSGSAYPSLSLGLVLLTWISLLAVHRLGTD